MRSSSAGRSAVDRMCHCSGNAVPGIIDFLRKRGLKPMLPKKKKAEQNSWMMEESALECWLDIGWEKS